VRQGPSALFASRYFAQADDRALAALYVHPRPGAEREVEALVREADPRASLTGYARFELALAESLRRELPRTGLVAAALVGLALWGALRRLRDAVLAASVLAIELAAVLLAARVFGIPLHVYDALVIPVLLGVTVDEAMFLLHRVRSAEIAASLDSEGPVDPIARGLAQQGRSIAATALTTAAGFGALAACRFDGLADLGRLGALGSVLGFAAAVLVVPAGLRLAAWAERGGGRAAS